MASSASWSSGEERRRQARQHCLLGSSVCHQFNKGDIDGAESRFILIYLFNCGRFYSVPNGCEAGGGSNGGSSRCTIHVISLPLKMRFSWDFFH